MKPLFTYIASLLTPPAFILNIYGIIGENINVCLLIGISVITMLFWVLAIKNKKLEMKKNKQELEAFKAQEEYFKLECDRLKKK
ncbi:MAG: hypothetical protein K9H26_10675 [Prolixibacteraceae bacterium]|nr:hypothetical protein [Prolixibacteraceae bacterium]